MFACCARKRVEARIVDGSLVVSLPGAEPPRVWRTELSQATSSIMEIRETQGKHWLVMKAQGREEDIAAFTKKTSAIDALQAVTDAMLDGAPGTSGMLGRLLRRVFKILFWLLLLAVAFFFLKGWAMRHIARMPAPAPAIEQGVPMPADDMFKQ